MSTVSRRTFLERTSMGAAAVGALVASPGLAGARPALAAPAVDLSHHELEGPIVAHVRNVHTGEIALMVGTREIVYRDPAFVKRLLRAARQ